MSERWGIATAIIAVFLFCSVGVGTGLVWSGLESSPTPQYDDAELRTQVEELQAQNEQLQIEVEELQAQMDDLEFQQSSDFASLQQQDEILRKDYMTLVDNLNYWVDMIMNLGGNK